MIKMGIVGYGYWGPNVLRNFYNCPETKVVSCCDKSPKRLKSLGEAYPDVKRLNDYQGITEDASIDAVAIVTPVSTHFEIAKSALLHDKHVFIEKPMTLTSAEGKELVELAAKKKKILMVDHTFLFTGAVQKIKEIVSKGDLGELYYFDSVRVNLGLFQNDINVIWDLAPHDLSIMNHVLDKKPIAVSAVGSAHVNPKIHDGAYLTVFFPDALIAHFHLNWLSPVKIRKTLVGGAKKMLVWDDLSADDKIKVYDKGIEISNPEDAHKKLVSYRSGDMWAPQIEAMEALKLEVAYFAESVNKGTSPFNDGEAGLEVVKILEASDLSLQSEGRRVSL